MMKHQQGITFAEFLLVAVILTVCGAFFSKFGSAIARDWKMNDQIQDVVNDMSSKAHGPREVMEAVDAKFEAQNITDIKAKQIISVAPSADLVVQKNYVFQNHFLGPVDLSIHFQKEFKPKGSK